MLICVAVGSESNCKTYKELNIKFILTAKKEELKNCMEATIKGKKLPARESKNIKRNKIIFKYIKFRMPKDYFTLILKCLLYNITLVKLEALK